jgi:hypothetical protein
MSVAEERPVVGSAAASAFAELRKLAGSRKLVERCELCSLPLGSAHPHLIDPEKRQLLCACNACAILFSGAKSSHYRRVAERSEFLPDFRLNDVQWEGLGIPIGLAYFFKSSATGRMIAIYPSPAGATESLLPLESWQELAAANPILHKLEPDVEALLVNRIGQARDCYRISIDRCYELVGLIRSRWRGLSGGAALWEEVSHFFAGLKDRSGAAKGGQHD